MAVLSNTARSEIRSNVAREFSRFNIEIPITKADLRALVNFMDGQLETTESTIFAALPVGDGKDWLLANQDLGRELLAKVERKRQEEI